MACNAAGWSRPGQRGGVEQRRSVRPAAAHDAMARRHVQRFDRAGWADLIARVCAPDMRAQWASQPIRILPGRRENHPWAARAVAIRREDERRAAGPASNHLRRQTDHEAWVHRTLEAQRFVL